MAGKYFFRYRNAEYNYPALVELTPEEHRAEVVKAGIGGWPRYERATAQRAHKWVKDGGHHETALYINHDGKIRYAKDEEGA